MNINWFPGHMVKAINEIKTSMKLIDVVVMVVDSRAVLSSENKIIFDIIENKPLVIVLNKYDLADKQALDDRVKEYTSKGYYTVLTNANTGEGIDKLKKTMIQAGEKVKYMNKTSEAYKDIKNIYRVLIAGVPNVGKSTVINKLAGKQSANVGNKPGVTVKKQWIRIGENIELMDTPGILWPKLEENDSGIKLALIGNIKDEILDKEELAIYLINYLRTDKKYTAMLKERYNLTDEIDNLEDYEVLEKIGKARGAITRGAEVDYLKTARILLEDFKTAKIGKINLE